MLKFTPAALLRDSGLAACPLPRDVGTFGETFAGAGRTAECPPSSRHAPNMIIDNQPFGSGPHPEPFPIEDGRAQGPV
jgi:hypothetical protein